jgi:hypothetical protein
VDLEVMEDIKVAAAVVKIMMYQDQEIEEQVIIE